MYLFRYLFLFLILLAITNCKTIKDVRLIKNTKVKPQYLSVGQKSIILAPIVHFGQKEFYGSLKDSIVSWKKNGYTVFYEEINASPGDIDELENDLKKFRKMTGGNSYAREDYAKLNSTFENAITQPHYPELGLDSMDVNADITIKQFLLQYEKLYGKLELDSCDKNTTLGSIYPCEKLKNDLYPVIDDYRNLMLVDEIIASKYDKIIVLYGAHHMKELKKMLEKK